MRTFIAATLGATALSMDISAVEHEFMNWLAEQGRSYGTREEYTFRLEQFARNHKNLIDMRTSPNFSTEVGHNQFSDWSEAEFNRLMGFRHDHDKVKEEKNIGVFPETNPSSVDWRAQGAVTRVKRQLHCGSGWAFSATGAMEGANKIQGNDLVTLSEQQLVDCSNGYGNSGCMGGKMAKAFAYAEESALVPEEYYPYQGKNENCNYNADDGVVKVESFSYVEPRSSTALKTAIAGGPVSVAIQASSFVFKLYQGGVISGSRCGHRLDHGVLAVGYGTDDADGGYYLVKNSWGGDWGEGGYVRISTEILGGQGVCGILLAPLRPETTNVQA